jgi:2-polyprenyl-3-methyl-5-hydroxy-6-metoxy-1,4-benzoquinol methylase
MAIKQFASLAADEIEKKKLLINAKETMKGNRKAARTLKAYLKEADQDEKFEEFDVVKLNEVLEHFYLNALQRTITLALTEYC